MPTVVTRDWEKCNLSDTDPQTAVEVYHVSGSFASDGDALKAVDTTTGLAVAQRGSTHSFSDALICKGPRISQIKSPLRYYVIQCDYDERGASEANDNKINTAPTWSWETVYVSELADKDAAGYAIVNAVGEPMPMPRDFFYKRLTFEQWEAFYDVGKCETFENSVNSVAMIIAGQNVPIGHMRLVTALPIGEQSAVQRYVRMRYVFEIVFGNQLGSYPFQHRVMNQGEWGYWNNGGTKTWGKFTAQGVNGQEVAGAVRLGLDGLPLTQLYATVKCAGQTPVGPPALDPAQPWADFEASDIAIWLIFTKCLSKDHRLLGLR